MDKLNSIEKAKFISKEYREYLMSSFGFKSKEYQKYFNDELDKESLFKGPYLSMTLPFVKCKSLNELIECGSINKGFKNLANIELDRKLYLHQEESINKINNGRSVVITTGTGSGKTECFLYPVINGIMNNINEGHLESGIRSLFLYPMNALVNDQIERIRKILCSFPEITYAYFTGDTPEKITKSERERMSEENQENPIPVNELLSREEIRNNPPHILFTNYSMLEYLMIRPSDQTIFNKKALDNWMYIVLDEAHSYNGTKAIELSFLLRRVTGMSNRQQQFILTSATLGEKGKSEQDIVNFAKNLTSVDYKVDDIIFSNRVKFDYPVKYRITNEEIDTIFDNKESINELCLKYAASCNGEIKENLYNLLLNDENIHKLYKILKNENIKFSEVYESMSTTISEIALIKLIDLVNYSLKGGTSVFELKYHSFVKALSGIFMIFGKTPKLTLTKTKYIDEYKAHEIGNCRFCNSSYIVGKEITDKKTGVKYLCQNDEVDIYENYGENENTYLDYFLIDDGKSENIKDNENLIEHECCVKCGSIYVVGNPNAVKCNCNDGRFKLYKVVNERNIKSNNISECPCCNRSSTNRIVRTLNLGKDEGTAIISQILYRSMGKSVKQGNAPQNKINLLRKKNNVEIQEKEIKQYLAFSDSRQQASFFAVFLKYNNTRFLQKRIIWEVIKNHNFENHIKMDVLVAELIKIIKEYNLFDNDLGETKNAWAAILVELLKVDGIYGGEGVGLFNFSIDLSNIMNQLDEEDVKEVFGKYGVDKAILERLIQASLSSIRTIPAVDTTKSTLTPEDKKEMLEYRRFDNYVVLKKPEKSKDKNIHSFLPVSGINTNVKYVMKALGCTFDNAEMILETIFNNIAIAEILDSNLMQDKYQINASKYVLSNYINTIYYRCKKCGTVTITNINNVCINGDCDGELEEIDPDVIFANNYYRKEYINRPIERIVVKEHTAQLTREKAKQYQKQFKEKDINILSCSTTFEMGIDIGDLGTVFMRNVPPSPANYVQRAGRVGRSKDSTAFILTYCNLSSHDYTYFSDPNRMIAGIIKPPVFNVINEKIIVRHLLAASLGFFFRNNSNYFKDIEHLIFNNGIKAFRDYMVSKPNDLIEYIDNKILSDSKYDKYKNFEWFINSDLIENLDIFESTIRDMMKEYSAAITKAQANEDFFDISYYGNQIKKMKEARVIDNLSRYSVIPKYGFPVDVVNLQIYDSNGHLDDRYDLSRDLSIAISEYAPDSEVIVDGNKYTSKFISLPKGNDLKKYFYYDCESCGRLNISNVQFFGTDNCKYCGNKNEDIKDNFFIEPSLGFKTGLNKESTRMKPVKSYAGEVQYIGGGDIDEHTTNINDSIFIETSSNDKLVIKNKANFYVCNFCGYGEVDKTNLRISSKKAKHPNCFKRICSNEELSLIRIGHVFKTDVARITCKQVSLQEEKSYEKMLSFMYAFLEGMSSALCIDRHDISGLILKNHQENCWDVLLYDNVPGGAGHVKRITNKEIMKQSLIDAYKKVNQECCDEDTSCYNCLRNYYNQSYHSIITRKFAKSIIERVLECCGV